MPPPGAMPRMRARSSALPGSSGGSGWHSSRYSMIASDLRQQVAVFGLERRHQSRPD